MIVLLFIFCILFAFWCSWQDNCTISLHKPINHKKSWIRRLTIMTMASSSILVEGNLHDTILSLIGSAFLFSAVFRISLNIRRGLDWRYMGIGAVYDRIFIMISSKNNNKEFINNIPNLYHRGNIQSREIIHRSGNIALIFESILTFLAILGIIFW